MQDYLIIGLAVAALLYILYKRKKKKEQQLGDELDYLIEKKDWHGVSLILRKQLIIWGALAAFMTAYVIVAYIMGYPKFAGIIMAAIFIWRTIKLAENYRKSRDNELYQQDEAEEWAEIQEETRQVLSLLDENNISATQVRADISPQALKNLWLESRERGKKEGFCPVLLLVTYNFRCCLDEIVKDKERFAQWHQQVLSSPVQDGQALLKRQFDLNKTDYEKEFDWQTDVIGDIEPREALNDFPILEDYVPGNLLLAEIPVSEPWQVFAYIPYGGWKNCPPPEIHMAVAKYWYERYGAEIAWIVPNLMYHVPQPVVKDAMTLAEEQFAYSVDTLQDYGNLATLAETNKKYTLWGFFWG